jgi:hypothetical protein
MGSSKGYRSCKESWQADESLLADDIDLDSLRERFVKRVYNDQMDEALPLVQKAYEMKKQNKFTNYFESWVDGVINEELEPDLDPLLDILADELPVGVDAMNASASLEATILADNENYEELSSQLSQMADEDPEADAREVIMSWMQQHMPRELEQITAEMTNDEPVTEDSWDNDEWDEDNVDAIQQAIVNRILANVNKHRDLLKKAGPDGVMNAARDVASSHAPMHEIGSSDVSIMVQEVYNEVGVPYPQDPIYEGKTKELAQDLEELTPRQFKAKYKQTKEEMRSKLTEDVAEDQGTDYVNRDEKLKRMGAKPLGMMDKLKTIPQGMKAFAKGDTEDDLALYNKSKSTVEEESVGEETVYDYAEWKQLVNQNHPDAVIVDHSWTGGTQKSYAMYTTDGMADEKKIVGEFTEWEDGDTEGTVKTSNAVNEEHTRDHNQLEEMRRLAGL